MVWRPSGAVDDKLPMASMWHHPCRPSPVCMHPACNHPCQALESAQQHAEALRCSAATLLAAAPPAAAEGEPDGRLPQLYDSRALQLWLLKCCQAVRRSPASACSSATRARAEIRPARHPLC